MNKENLKQVIEALVFASDSPVSLKQLLSYIGDETLKNEDIKEAVDVLNKELEGRAYYIRKVSGGYQFATRPEFSQWLHTMYESKAQSKMTRAALETLAIIAFKQPISRVEVSAIRGVNSDHIVKKLLERNLITITGRDKGAGRALLFVTTPQFLQYFNLNDISDLPRPKEIEEMLADGEGGKLLKEIPDSDLQEEEETQEPQQDEKKADGAEPEEKNKNNAEPAKDTDDNKESKPDTQDDTNEQDDNSQEIEQAASDVQTEEQKSASE